MRIFFLFTLFLLSNKIEAQSESNNHRVVLVSDSGEIFGKKFPADAFSGSYFVCAYRYGVPFSDQEFNDFAVNVKNFNSEITVYKASDNSSLVCIFPKTALKGITTFTAFVNSKLSPNVSSNLVSSKTTHIEVVTQFDPLDKENEKGFNQLTN